MYYIVGILYNAVVYDGELCKCDYNTVQFKSIFFFCGWCDFIVRYLNAYLYHDS